MRLLELQASGELVLREFYGSNIPPYAILSHTWHVDNSREVSYADIQRNSYRNKAGVSKVRFCGTQAAQDGLRFAWVDTCCVDRSSSAELTEAINSMFTWYKDAEVCYVYLSDVDLDHSIDIFESALEKSRWFTRGWCLQELLAPSDLRLYDRNWQFIGSKTTMADLLCRITRVDKDILHEPSRLYSVPIARRMSWASARKTSRIEDIAYSLLGIFDVQMPLLYGEGEKAFLRLQEEIIKRSNDLSIFAWTTQRQRDDYQGMFASTPSCFSDCHAIVYTGDGDSMLSDSVFSMTNRGIQFVSAGMKVISSPAGYDDYLLPLGCSESNRSLGLEGFLRLKKIRPGLFVRVVSPGDDGALATRPILPYAFEKEVYVVTTITPAVCRSIETTHHWSFEIGKWATHASSFPIVGLEPRGAWDDAQWRFLTLGDINFSAYVKIAPGDFADQRSDFFVIVFSFLSVENEARKPFACPIPADIWQRNHVEGRSLGLSIHHAIGQHIARCRAHRVHFDRLESRAVEVKTTLQTRLEQGASVYNVGVDFSAR